MTEEKPKEPETVEEKVKELAGDKQTVEEVPKSDLEILKEKNDAYEKELFRQQELKSKSMIGGRAEAGQPEETQEDKDEKEAAENLSTFQ